VKGGHRRSRGDRNPWSLKRPHGARRRARFHEEPPEEPLLPAERDAALDELDELHEPDRRRPLWPPEDLP
jgi:hypothetical protein